MKVLSPEFPAASTSCTLMILCLSSAVMAWPIAIELDTISVTAQNADLARRWIDIIHVIPILPSQTAWRCFVRTSSAHRLFIPDHIFDLLLHAFPERSTPAPVGWSFF